MFSWLPSSLLGLSIFDLYSEEMEEGSKFYILKSKQTLTINSERSAQRSKMGGSRFLTIYRRKLLIYELKNNPRLLLYLLEYCRHLGDSLHPNAFELCPVKVLSPPCLGREYQTSDILLNAGFECSYISSLLEKYHYLDFKFGIIA